MEIRPRTTNYEVIQCDWNLGGDRCFACSACNKCQSGKGVILQGRQTYCWECFGRIFGLKCASCFKSITGLTEMSFIFYNNKVWHHDCFGRSSWNKSHGQSFRDSTYWKPRGGFVKFLIG